MATAPSPRLRHFPDISCPMPFLRDTAVSEAFVGLRDDVIRGAGFDYLAKLGDMMRPKGFVSNKAGVANRSRHKAADAFDVNQEDNRAVVVREDSGGRAYFRVYLLCVRQDKTSGGRKLNLTAWNFATHKPGQQVCAYFFDFTMAALNRGFKRIPAWSAWESSRKYKMSEWWHYEMTEGLTWDEAMAYLYGTISNQAKPKPADKRVLGLNDRGEQVRQLQTDLARIGFLRDSDIDGIYGHNTHDAVSAFQASAGLSIDGVFGPATWAKLRKYFETLKN